MRFPAILLASLILVGGAVWAIVAMNQHALFATLEGSILRVRTYPLGPNSTVVFAEFRITNPLATPFRVSGEEIFVDSSAAKTLREADIFVTDMYPILEYQRTAEPKFYDFLENLKPIKPGETAERMTYGRFELPLAEIDKRFRLRVRIFDARGNVAEITENLSQK